MQITSPLTNPAREAPATSAAVITTASGNTEAWKPAGLKNSVPATGPAHNTWTATPNPAKLPGEVLGEARDKCLRRQVDRPPRAVVECHQRRHVDDPAVTGVDHLRKHRTGGSNQTRRSSSACRAQRSATTVSALAPAAEISDATPSSRRRSRPTSVTVAPSRASRRANAAPIPTNRR
jgi:hypothetical protein